MFNKSQMSPEKSAFKLIVTAALLVALAFSLCYAFYTGFRAPNVWSAGYYQFSWLDGFYRRGLIGTLLYPFGCERYNYHFIKFIEWAILAALLGAILYIGLRAKATLFLCLYFASAAGGFLFHEVGYIEQLLWLLAGASIYLAHKNYYLTASIILTITLLIHEMAIFVTLPLMMAYLLVYQRVTFKILLKLFAAPGLIFLGITLSFQQSSPTAIADHLQRAKDCGYPVFRTDFMQVFANNFKNRAENYYIGRQLLPQIGSLILLALALALAIREKTNHSLLAQVTLVLCCSSPLLLGFFGWDTNRWLFITFTQILFIGILFHTRTRPNTHQLAMILVPFAIVALITSYNYFDGFMPREWTMENLINFVDHVTTQLTITPRG